MLVLRGARVIDPAAGVDEIKDVFIKDGVFAEFEPAGAEVIDAPGLILAPGLVDMHVHFRDPGFTDKEDILTGAASAAAGGVTTAVCMPNTEPVIDSAERVSCAVKRAEAAAVRVLNYAAVTTGQGGRALTDFRALKNAGAAALSDDGNPIMSADLMRRALVFAREAGLVISCHCEDADIVQSYAVNEGAISQKLGIPGRPAIAEELMVARDA
ncbi:MAG: amidohydrolase family protein, partial [Clostridiales bacterium]|nr:amidohydrolase family protein [Clostridiales bacterium]